MEFQVDGRTSGALYNNYLMTDRVLATIIFSGQFLAMGLLIFGILTGLATIIWNLSYQSTALSGLTRRALGRGLEGVPPELPRPYLPTALLWAGGAGVRIGSDRNAPGVYPRGVYRLGAWQNV